MSVAMDRQVLVAVESPDQPEIRKLIEALNAELLSKYRPEECHHLTIGALMQSDVTFFVARRAGAAIGCGALRRIEDAGEPVGEVKRMYTKREARGQGVGRLVLRAIEALARREHLARLLLETGHRQPDAVHLYRSEGFRERGPYLDYPDNGVSIFMEKRL
jgi:putative acetyltransferase